MSSDRGPASSTRSGLLPGDVARWVELHTTLYSQTLRAAQNLGSDITRAGLLRDAIASGNVSPQLQKLIADSIGIDPESIKQRLENPRTDAPADFVEDSSYSLGHPEGRQLPQKGKPVSGQKQHIPKTSDRLDSSLLDDPVKYPPHEQKKIVESWLHSQGVITDPDGETVLMPNPEKRTVNNRALHLIASHPIGQKDLPRESNAAKAGSVFSIPQTITDYQVKGISDDKTQIAYFRKYGNTLHMVLVDAGSRTPSHHGLNTHRPVYGGDSIAGINVLKTRTAENEQPDTPNAPQELPDWTGPEQTAQEISIPGAPKLTEEQLKETEDRAYEQVRQSRILDVDAVLPHIPGFSEAHPLTRDRAYRRTARDITRKLLDRLLAEPKTSGKVIIVSGGAGSGKTELAELLASDADLVIEATIADIKQLDSLRHVIDASGRQADFRYIHRTFQEAFQSLIHRHIETKIPGNSESSSITPLDAAIESHIRSRGILSTINDRTIAIYDNRSENIQKISLDKLEKYNYNQSHGQLARTWDRPGKGKSLEKKTSRTGSPNAGDSRESGAAERLGAIGLEIIEGFRTSGRLTNAEAAAFAGRVGQVQVRLAGAHQALPQRRIPASEIGSVGRRLEDLSRGVGGGEDASRIGSEVLGKWGAETGLLIDPDWWRTTVMSWPKTPSGTEHDGFRDNQSHRVLSIQKSSSGGQAGLPPDYFKSIQLINLIFEDDIRIEGVVDLKDKDNRIGTTYSLVISHPFTDGTHPSAGQIENWMSSRGYSSEGNNTYYNRDTDVRVRSATPENFIKTGNGNLLPIGVAVESDFTVEELTELIGGN